MARRYWLMKSDPQTFGLRHLKRSQNRTTCWDGVRNYQARNLLRDEIKKGDVVLYYHSRTPPMGVAGLARVVREGYPDPTQFDAKDKYHDPKSQKDAPRWYCVDIKFTRKFKNVVTLAAMKAEKRLGKMMVVQRGARLSVQPVTKAAYEIVLEMATRG